MKILFRACQRQESISHVPRLGNLDKTTIIKKCWTSLHKSITNDDEVILINDNLDDNLLEFLNADKVVDVPKHTCESGDLIYNVVLYDIVEKLLQETNEIIYTPEDDYLHTSDALHIMRALEYKYEGFIVPQDYPDRYKDNIPCTILQGMNRPWRTITSSTLNLAATNSAWKQTIVDFKLAAPYANDKILDDIYKRIPCISPLPGIATHLTEGCMTPYVNWDKVWNEC